VRFIKMFFFPHLARLHVRWKSRYSHSSTRTCHRTTVGVESGYQLKSVRCGLYEKTF